MLVSVAVSLSAREIDQIVGHRVRQRRETLGISQGRLGRHLGLTFSQVQKYEKGSNRIGAGRLYQIADYLGVTPSYFFEDLQGPDRPDAAEVSAATRSEIRRLTESFSQIDDPDTRASVIALVRSLIQAPRS